MEIVKSNILKSRNIKDISAKIYVDSINRLHKSLYNEDLVNLNFLYNFDEIVEHLKIFKLSVQKNMLSSIVVALSCKEKNTELHSKYFKILDECIKKYKNRNKEDIPTTIKDLETCLRKLKKILNNNFLFNEDVIEITNFDRQILNRYLVGCLYTYFPPRLSKDYKTMEIISYEDFNQLEKQDRSYLVVINSQQKFFSFYTEKKTKDIKINKKFNEVLNLYLKFHKKKIFIPYKVKINNQAINYYIKDCFSLYKINFTKLRKIYIKDKVLPLSFEKAREVIDNMGYGDSCNLVILYQNNKMN